MRRNAESQKSSLIPDPFPISVEFGGKGDFENELTRIIGTISSTKA